MSKSVMQMFADEIAERDKKISKLEKQLVEKDARIKKLHLEAQQYFEDAYCNDFQDRAKAEFAIEQLEKVKEKLEVLLKNTEKELNSITDFEFHNKVQGSMKGYMDSINIIDQQIHELKGEENV